MSLSAYIPRLRLLSALACRSHVASQAPALDQSVRQLFSQCQMQIPAAGALPASMLDSLRLASSWSSTADSTAHIRMFSSAENKEAESKEGGSGRSAVEGENPESQAGAAGEAAQEGMLSPGEMRAQLEEKDATIAELKEKVETLTDSFKRSLAETENVRMRATRDVDAAKKFAVQGFVKSLLEVVDNLERAAAAVPEEALAAPQEATNSAEESDKLRKLLDGLMGGVKATEKIMLHTLKMNGVERYDPSDPPGQKFDPNLHMALFEVTDATKEVGTVAVVSKRGYKLHDRVIRPAECGVVRAP